MCETRFNLNDIILWKKENSLKENRNSTIHNRSSTTERAHNTKFVYIHPLPFRSIAVGIGVRTLQVSIAARRFVVCCLLYISLPMANLFCASCGEAAPMEGCSKCNRGDFSTRLSKALRALLSKREDNMETNHKVLWAAVETKSPKLYARDLTQIVHASGGLVYDARVCRAGEDEWNLQLKCRLNCPDHVLHRAKLQALILILENSVNRHSPRTPR